jgi:hypothetical protein
MHADSAGLPTGANGGRPRPADRALGWPVAAGLVGVVWAVGWADGTVNAVEILAGTFHPTPVTSLAAAVSAAVTAAAGGLAVVVLAVLTARAVGVSTVDRGLRRPPEQRRSLSSRARSHAASGLSQLVAAAVFAVGYGLLNAVDRVVPTRGYPYPAGRWAALPELVHAILAGPTEELALVALPTVLFRRAGLPWPAVGLIAVGLRLPFHLYYGWGTLGVACWATVVWAWYARTGRLWGPVVVHSAIDVLAVTLALGGRHRLGFALAELGTGAALAIVLTGVWSAHLRRSTDLPRGAMVITGAFGAVPGSLSGRPPRPRPQPVPAWAGAARSRPRAAGPGRSWPAPPPVPPGTTPPPAARPPAPTDRASP